MSLAWSGSLPGASRKVAGTVGDWGMALTAITPLQGTRRRAQQGAKSGELLTLLLTPGRFRSDKPSQDKGL